MIKSDITLVFLLLLAVSSSGFPVDQENAYRGEFEEPFARTSDLSDEELVHLNEGYAYDTNEDKREELLRELFFHDFGEGAEFNNVDEADEYDTPLDNREIDEEAEYSWHPEKIEDEGEYMENEYDDGDAEEELQDEEEAAEESEPENHGRLTEAERGLLERDYYDYILGKESEENGATEDEGEEENEKEMEEEDEGEGEEEEEENDSEEMRNKEEEEVSHDQEGNEETVKADRELSKSSEAEEEDEDKMARRAEEENSEVDAGKEELEHEESQDEEEDDEGEKFDKSENFEEPVDEIRNYEHDDDEIGKGEDEYELLARELAELSHKLRADEGLDKKRAEHYYDDI